MLHPVAVSFKEDQVSVVYQAVNHCRCHLVIRKDAAPFGELQIGGQQQALALITVRDYPEQQLGTVTVNRYIPPFVLWEVFCYGKSFLRILEIQQSKKIYFT